MSEASRPLDEAKVSMQLQHRELQHTFIAWQSYDRDLRCV